MSNQKPLVAVFVAAHLWQSRGWHVIPAQPDSKRLIAGYGPHLEKLTSGESLEFWFRDRGANIAVVAPESGVILDFDRIEVYNQFVGSWPVLAESYTESTPRGGRHVFLWSVDPVPTGLDLRPGIEVKRVCMVYPSTVGGKPYTPVSGGAIVRADVAAALRPFLVGGGSKSLAPTTPPVLGHPGGKQRHPTHTAPNTGILAKVKANWTILEYLSYFEPKLILTGSGRWLVGRCPWHNDSRPSLWVDADRNLWGCHACPAHGDIVNWHALRLSTQDMILAARDLGRYRVEVAR